MTSGMARDMGTKNTGPARPAVRSHGSAPDLAQGANLMPGPVPVHPSTAAALTRPAISHRASDFVADLARIRTRLCRLVGARHAQVLMGSGTLANDAVAAQLRAGGQRGLVVHSGEFGERLLDHARRYDLPIATLEGRWGADLPYHEIDEALAADPTIRWMWAVHCETSTGVLHDLRKLVEICRARGVELVMDCISSVGAAPVDLDGVSLATAVSGKAMASFAGLAIVFHDQPIARSPSVPRYLDLGSYLANDGVAYTISSNLVYALEAALLRFGGDVMLPGDNGHLPTDASPVAVRVGRRIERAIWLREELRSRGFDVVASDACAAPAVTSILLPEQLDSVAIGDALVERGFQLSYNSGYLVRRNVIQICMMGEHPPEALAELPGLLTQLS